MVLVLMNMSLGRHPPLFEGLLFKDPLHPHSPSRQKQMQMAKLTQKEGPLLAPQRPPSHHPSQKAGFRGSPSFQELQPRG